MSGPSPSVLRCVVTATHVVVGSAVRGGGAAEGLGDRGTLARLGIRPDRPVLYFSRALNRALEVHAQVLQPGDALPTSSFPGAMQQSVECHGVYGFFHFSWGPALVLCVDSAPVAPTPCGGWLFAARKFRLVRVGLAGEGGKEEKEAERLMMGLLQGGGFFFGQHWDATVTAQKVAKRAGEERAGEGGGGGGGGGGVLESAAVQRMLRRGVTAEKRFCFNLRASREILSAHGGEAFFTPFIHGFVGYAPGLRTTHGESVDLVLVSRRGVSRQGTRYFRRGADVEGNVANFVETEQWLLHATGEVDAYVQVRGSVPLLWEQYPTLKWAPRVELSSDSAKNASVAKRHLQSLSSAYGGKVVVVNLIDGKGDQAMLGEALEHAVETFPPEIRHQMHLYWWDFHSHCKGMKWHRLQRLVEEVALESDGIGWLQVDAGGKVMQWQRGVVRTNCMDNLDRTNVVQSIFARRTALAALPTPESKRGAREWLDELRRRAMGGDAGALESGTRAGVRVRSGSEGTAMLGVMDSPLEEVEGAFKHMWADNADALSQFYGGAPAQKTDVTRTGKRTIAGALADGHAAISRYFINHFGDAKRQDAWDLLVANGTAAIAPLADEEATSTPPPDPSLPPSTPPTPQTPFLARRIAGRPGEPTVWRLLLLTTSLVASAALSASLFAAYLFPTPEAPLQAPESADSIFQKANFALQAAKHKWHVGAIAATVTLAAIGYVTLAKGKLPLQHHLVATPRVNPEPRIKGYTKETWAKGGKGKKK